MKVTLLAHTQIAGDQAGQDVTADWMASEFGAEFSRIPSADHLAEFAGRACYQSFDRPNPQTAANKDYLANILRQQHFSVLEHASATFYIEGVSRSLTHELVRHRHLSFSQLSQRYVDETSATVVIPPALTSTDDPENLAGKLRDHLYDARLDYAFLVEVLMERGFSRKRAREAARAVLPNSTETKIVVTGNHRAWREFLTKRLSPAADAEIQLLALEIRGELVRIAPNTYQDLV